MTTKFKGIAGLSICLAGILLLSNCVQSSKESESPAEADAKKVSYGGYESNEKWGEHLVTIAGCGDCHTPKKMTDHGPVLDSSLSLSGHPAGMPSPDINRGDMEKKGLIVTQTLTSWVGPWGVSYAGNLTSDQTGIGGWTEEAFFTAIRKGKFKGIESNRPLLPPMPWEVYANFTDDELKAIFAYLKSTNPVSNVVPQFDPPALAQQH